MTTDFVLDALERALYARQALAACAGMSVRLHHAQTGKTAAKAD